MANLLQEMSQTLRRLVRDPRIPVVIVLTLALGTAANLSIFAVVRAALLDPLPFAEADRLLGVTWVAPGGAWQPLSPAELTDLRRRVGSFERVGAYYPWTFNIAGIEVPDRVAGAVVTGNLFSVLGVRPALGHGFEADGPAAAAEVLLSDGLWRRRFGAAPDIVGRKLWLDEIPVTVAGVMPAEFRFPVNRVADLWKVSPDSDQMPREMRFYLAVGRLAPGVAAARAEAELASFAESLAREYPEINKGLVPRVKTLRDTVVQGFERNLLLLQLTVAAALFMACFNVAILQLGRAEERRGEMALRYALGAQRFQILRQALWENLLLGVGGGLAGAALATLGVRLLVRFGPASIHRLDLARVSGVELAVAVALGALCGLLIGQLPALLHSRRALATTLQPGLRTASGTWMRGALVVAQVAVTLVLLAACGLFVRSLERLTSVDLGFDPDAVLATGVSLSSEYQSIESFTAFFGELRGRLESVPGVERVATAVSPPLVRGFLVNHEFDIVGRPLEADTARRVAAIRPVSPGFFELLEIPVRRGRVFTDADDARSLPVAVVNEAFIRAFLEAEGRAIDERLAIPLDYGAEVGRLLQPEWRIVGVVGDLQQVDLQSAEVPAIYLSTLQAPWMETRILVRTRRPPAVVAPEIERAVRDLLPSLPVLPVRSLRAAADEFLAPVRFQLGMAAAFAGLALLLMCVGLYATLSHSVVRRRPEISLRIALGATRWQIGWLIVRQALWIVGLGLLFGCVASVWVGRAIASLLFGVHADDPALYLAAVLLLLVATLFGCWPSVRRAVATDPAGSLRVE